MRSVRGRNVGWRWIAGLVLLSLSGCTPSPTANCTTGCENYHACTGDDAAAAGCAETCRDLTRTVYRQTGCREDFAIWAECDAATDQCAPVYECAGWYDRVLECLNPYADREADGAEVDSPPEAATWSPDPCVALCERNVVDGCRETADDCVVDCADLEREHAAVSEECVTRWEESNTCLVQFAVSSCPADAPSAEVCTTAVAAYADACAP